MKINIKKNLDLTPALRDYMDEKLLPLAKFIKKYDATGEAELWLELSRTSQHHGKGEEVFLAVADLRLPKKILRAEEYADDIRKAIDQARNALHMEIEKYKTRIEKAERGSGRG